tara:strand:- start:17 stop:355 length:339 start_codon:yes stop_codon:yes gene_type:complete
LFEKKENISYGYSLQSDHVLHVKSCTQQWRPTGWFVVLKMDEFALAIELKSGSKILFSALKSFPVTSTLSDVCNSFNQSANLVILKVEVSDQQTGPWRQTEPEIFSASNKHV